MPIVIEDLREPYSCRICRCGAVMRPGAESPRHAWACPACGRVER